MRKHRKSVALLVATTLLMSTFNIGIIKADNKSDNVLSDDLVISDEAKAINSGEKYDIGKYDILDIVKESLISEGEDINNYVREFEEEENLNTVIVGNDSGKRIMYTYSYPVKWVDDNEFIKDISLEAIKSGEKGIAYESSGDYLTFNFQSNLKMELH